MLEMLQSDKVRNRAEGRGKTSCIDTSHGHYIPEPLACPSLGLLSSCHAR
jgi:hypothetical protein